MKKAIKVLFFAVLFMVASPLLMHAQDSTAVVDTTTVSIAQTILAALGAKWGIVGVVGTILFFVSEGLSLIPAVKSNGVFQLIGSILGMFKKK